MYFSLKSVFQIKVVLASLKWLIKKYLPNNRDNAPSPERITAATIIKQKQLRKAATLLQNFVDVLSCMTAC